MLTRDACNAYRHDAGAKGHYESYFVRANHPTRPLAFWIRYTMFSPRGRPDSAVGELWAVYFDGEARQIAATKQVVPLSECSFSRERLAVRIGQAELDDAQLTGSASNGATRIAWSLRYSAPQAPILLFPEKLYETRLPKAKALVAAPFAVFQGELTVDGQRVAVDDWVGSQNHNWGSQHTDRYAWGQVAGFDNAKDVFLECATASIRVGRFFTPPISPLVLRLDGEEFGFNTVLGALRAKGRYRPFSWQLSAEHKQAKLEVNIEAEPHAFVALPYDNPPGGQKICLNSKLAACQARLTRAGRPPVVFSTQHRAAFEILQDEPVPGVARLVV